MTAGEPAAAREVICKLELTDVEARELWRFARRKFGITPAVQRAIDKLGSAIAEAAR